MSTLRILALKLFDFFNEGAANRARSLIGPGAADELQSQFGQREQRTAACGKTGHVRGQRWVKIGHDNPPGGSFPRHWGLCEVVLKLVVDQHELRCGGRIENSIHEQFLSFVR